MFSDLWRLLPAAPVPAAFPLPSAGANPHAIGIDSKNAADAVASGLSPVQPDGSTPVLRREDGVPPDGLAARASGRPPS